MRNVHERELPVPSAAVGALLDRLASPDDPLWPAPAWFPIELDGPLAAGARGGHGPIRYSVQAYAPGRSVRFRFAPGQGLDGYHELVVEPRGEQACVLRHVLDGRTSSRMTLAWPIAVRWLHDAVVEDLLDNAERAVGGAVAGPARWSLWVRLLRRLDGPRPIEVPLPADAALARTAFDRIDFADAWQLGVWRGLPGDPAAWTQAIFRDPPGWVTALLRLRNALVRLIGIERGDASAFDVRTRSAQEALVGTDAGHLDFRASVLVQPGSVTLSTVVTVHNWRGRLYLLPVRLVHPAVVRAMLRRAGRRLASRPEQNVMIDV